LRIDPDLKETATSSGHQFDIGLNYEIANLQFSIELENIFNEFYTQHLLYIRDPFSYN